jgi:dihydropteroate synthase
MEADGADIIDVGGESTRPNADFVSDEVEMERIIPIITSLRKTLKESTVISVDTRKSKVAAEAINSGADVVNDVSGGNYDPAMYATISKLRGRGINLKVYA